MVEPAEGGCEEDEEDEVANARMLGRASVLKDEWTVEGEQWRASCDISNGHPHAAR